MRGIPSASELALNLRVRPWSRAATDRDEATLIRQARGGSAEAVESLVRRRWDSAHRTAFLIVHDAAAAEDIAQEAMLAAVRAIDGFDRRRRFGPWLERIVVQAGAGGSCGPALPPEHQLEPLAAHLHQVGVGLVLAVSPLDGHARNLRAGEPAHQPVVGGRSDVVQEPGTGSPSCRAPRATRSSRSSRMATTGARSAAIAGAATSRTDQVRNAG